METVANKPKRRTLFDLIESPEPGWSTRRIEKRVHIDRPDTWRVELLRDSDGAPISHECESLFLAWVRATEQAHSYHIGLSPV